MKCFVLYVRERTEYSRRRSNNAATRVICSTNHRLPGTL